MTIIKKTILAFDTSMSQCSIALLYNKNIYCINRICIKNHSNYVLPMIKEILQKKKISLHNIDYISTLQGPGNFSGIRLSLSIIQGLSLGLNNISFIPLSTILVMAQQAWKIYKIKKVLILFVIDKKNIYWIQYIRNKQKKIWVLYSPGEILNIYSIYKKINLLRDKWIVVGNGINLLLNKLTIKNIFITNIQSPNAKYIISLILSNEFYQQKVSLSNITPTYLQNTK
ncbi:MAG: tRNA (adenosine(37)-N6)-threonylcarbamoyltransferase complex dimerization subunit type 1 TsaB [Buchnera aphidicola (Chaetogeoica yunlongensis)]